MTATSLRAPRRTAAALLSGLVLLPLAGCGSDEGGSGASGSDRLARLVPATAPFYFEATIRPDGDQKSDLDALVQKFKPGATVDQLVQQAIRKQGSGDKVDFERDVKPWLGDHAAAAVLGAPRTGSTTPDFAVLVETTDGDKALAAVRKDVDGTAEDRTYQGTKYLFDTGDATAAAILDDTLVVGTETGLKASIDASKGDGLAGSAEFAKVVDAVDDDALGIVYGDVAKGLDLIVKSAGDTADAQSLEGARELANRQGVKTFAAGLTADADAVTVHAAATPSGGKAGADETDATATSLAALPAGAWAAAGLGDLGKSLSEGLDTLKTIKTPGLNVQSGLDQLEQQAGIDVQKDLLSWMGQAGLFVRGTSLTDIGGALVVQSKDAAATKAALAKARTLVAGAGLPAQDLSGNGIDDGFSVAPGTASIQVFAALAGNRFVLALNRSALDEALKPTTKLGDDDTYKAAADLLDDGQKPTFLVDFPKINGLIGLLAGSQPGFAQAKPYLDRIGTIVAGGKRDGDLARSTFAIGVK